MKKVLVVLAIAAMCGSIAQAETGSCTSGSFTVDFSNAILLQVWAGVPGQLEL